MIKANIRKVRSNINPSLSKKADGLDDLAKDAYDYFREITPKRSGNARSKTKLNKDTISADYAYATRLNKGYSKQAPKGMFNPTVDYIRRQLIKIFGR